MEKQCKLCGVFFDALRRDQRFCKDCTRKSPSKHLRTITRRSHAKYDDKPLVQSQVITCKHCGKQFKASNDMWYTKFCSTECRDTYYINHTVCAVCNKPMRGSGDEHFTSRHEWFCSEECRTIRQWELARASGKVKTCPYCSNEFLGDNKYCSIECAKLGAKVTKMRPVTQTITRRCLKCRQIFQTQDINTPFCTDCIEKARRVM